jgi:YbdK family carboxylate-amine ligase
LHRFGRTAAEQLTCGCHVHVAVTSDDEAVAAVDRLQPWLPVLLALTVNSPFWDGLDSGYGSFRSQVWGRWPSAGPTGPFGSAAEYHRFTEELLRTETVLDRGMLYFDARPSHHHPTVEVRVADVCRDPRDTLLLAALTRGAWSRPRPASGRPGSHCAPPGPRCCASPRGGPRGRGSTTPCSCRRTGDHYRPTTWWAP